jgi:DNA (cytosine-5)-methyltransferase 1
MKFNKIKLLVIEALKKHYPEDNFYDELEAVATHLIQTPGFSLPFTNPHKNKKIIQNLSVGLRKNKEETLTFNEESEVYQPRLFVDWNNLPYPPPSKWDFTFIDLFAGIGGFRLAMESVGGKCVFSSEWDKFAKKTYEANFGEVPFGDIKKISKENIPNHDVLCAGFPCQPFSLAGVSKKKSLGRKHGFSDETQGTLFFELKEIIRLKRPKAFFLENVKNLLSHDKGQTFEIIRSSLEEKLGYVINWKVVDGANWVPQHRERIFIVGFDPEQVCIDKAEIDIPEKPAKKYFYPELNKIIKRKMTNHTLGPGTWRTLERHKANHASKGNGFGYGLIRLPIKKGMVTRTISARYHKDGAEILVEQKNERPRRLSVKEAMQLQGFDPDKFLFPVSNTQAYRQIGNSVVVPAIKSTSKMIAKILLEKGRGC